MLPANHALHLPLHAALHVVERAQVCRGAEAPRLIRQVHIHPSVHAITCAMCAAQNQKCINSTARPGAIGDSMSQHCLSHQPVVGKYKLQFKSARRHCNCRLQLQIEMVKCAPCRRQSPPPSSRPTAYAAIGFRRVFSMNQSVLPESRERAPFRCQSPRPSSRPTARWRRPPAAAPPTAHRKGILGRVEQLPPA